MELVFEFVELKLCDVFSDGFKFKMIKAAVLLAVCMAIRRWMCCLKCADEVKQWNLLLEVVKTLDKMKREGVYGSSITVCLSFFRGEVNRPGCLSVSCLCTRCACCYCGVTSRPTRVVCVRAVCVRVWPPCGMGTVT